MTDREDGEAVPEPPKGRSSLLPPIEAELSKAAVEDAARKRRTCNRSLDKIALHP